LRLQFLLWPALAILLTSCAVYSAQQFDNRFGPSQPRQRLLPAASSDARLFREQIKPILDQRCVVCHACYDAPCQLKLSSPQGIDRGIHSRKVYNSTRLLADPPSRLFEDEQSVQGWRRRGFEPVLNERDQTPKANREGSLLYRVLRLKQQQPLPSTLLLPDSFELGLDPAQQCRSVERYDQIETQRPLWGMPYGLPGLSATQLSTMTQWISQGAPMPESSAVTAPAQATIDHWERFFNNDTLQGQLVARYLYEHLYLFHLYFTDRPQDGFYNLVRSATPPGKPLQRISTRRPYDDPATARVYYRLVTEPATIVAKTHLPYALDSAREQRWQTLFFGSDIPLERLPSYAPDQASNPFTTFAAIPAAARYRFLLDEAQATIMAFIKGPVCRGQVAVNVINEQFWVFFADPNNPISDDSRNFLAEQADTLALPGATSNSVLPLSAWVTYAAKQADYLEAKTRWFNQQITRGLALNEQLIWDGDGHNRNAALTVFRHFDNASVTQGLLGTLPKTAWVIDYPLLERIHYLLVAGFDVFGNFGHQLTTRLYMDFLRMEGEFNFLSLLPPAIRQRERDAWYQDADPSIRDYIFSRHSQLQGEPGIDYRTDDPKAELLHRLMTRFEPVTTHNPHQLRGSALHPDSIALLQRLEQLRGGGIARLPEVTLMMIDTAQGGSSLVSLIHHRAHANISSLFDEKAALRPAEDSLTILTGVVGDYPNALWWIDESQLPELANGIFGLQSEADYRSLVSRFGVRRNDPRFWQLSDRIAARYRETVPLEAGILDYNRLENR